MDDLLEALMAIFIELPADLAMQSSRLKPWVKTTAFCIMGGVVCLFLYWLTWTVRGNPVSLAVIGGISIFLTALVIFGAIRGHKNGWKQ